VNRSIAIATAKGVVKAHNPSLLAENGGSVSLGRKWAESLFKRMNFVKRKATKAARKLPKDFDELKAEFIRKVQSNINPADGLPIPFELVLNWDQTGSKLVPVCEWTLASEGSKQVPLKGLDDKKQITVLLAITMAGDMLPPQLLYTGKTPQCHPSIGKAKY
jgi:hypothetical protein